MDDDIVIRLRICESEYGVGDTVREAADEIERLRADRDNWRVTADLMYAHYHNDNGTELVAVYEQAVRGE